MEEIIKGIDENKTEKKFQVKLNRVELRKFIKRKNNEEGKKRHWENTNPQMLRKKAKAV